MSFLPATGEFETAAFHDQTLRVVQAGEIVGQFPYEPLPEYFQAIFRVSEKRGPEGQASLRHPCCEDWQKAMATALHNLGPNHVVIIAEVVEADEETATPKGFHGGGSGEC